MLPPRNVLIFHSGALGDFVLSWPLALALARLHPQSRIIYVAQKQKGLLAEHVLRVESTDVEAGWHHLYGDATKLPAAASKMLAGAHSVYSFVAGPEDAWVEQVRAIALHAQVHCLKARPPEDYPRHASDFLLEELAAHKALAEAVRQMLLLVHDRGLGGVRHGAGGIVIHPGSGGREKCWPAENFSAVAQRLIEKGHNVRFVIGEVELERWSEAEIERFERIAEVIRPADLVQLWMNLCPARLFLGNDSGPAHLAGIAGVRSLCLYGPTDPAVWKPMGPAVRTLRQEPLSALSIERVLELTGESLD